MTEKKNVSSLSEHILHKKKGLVATPFNDKPRDVLILSSWRKSRMPEYLWLGLILMKYRRKEGIEKAAHILLDISKINKSLTHPKLSTILSLPPDDQKTIYEIISKHIDKQVVTIQVDQRNKTPFGRI